MQGEKNSRKGKQRNKCRKHIIGLKSENLKKEREEKKKRKEKKNTPELQKPNIEAEFYNHKKSVTEYTHIPISKIKQSNKNKV